jgi:hypothetical protein
MAQLSTFGPCRGPESAQQSSGRMFRPFMHAGWVKEVVDGFVAQL